MVSSVITELQTQSPSWQWQNWNGLPYLTCSLLQNWQHGFFTQQCYPHSPKTLVEALEPNASVYRVKQVHGNRVLSPAEIEIDTNEYEGENALPPADGIMADQPQQSVWVASADCTPVLIGDCQTGRVAAIHAGWRGTAQRIVPEAVARFLEIGGSLDNLRVAMGPAIAGAVYQVTEQVAAEVGSSLLQEEADTSEGILAALEEMSQSPISADPQPGRVRLDVRHVNVLQLKQLGIKSEQIAIAPYCTYQQPDYFFSYRRTKQKQVQWSGIVSRKVES